MQNNKTIFTFLILVLFLLAAFYFYKNSQKLNSTLISQNNTPVVSTTTPIVNNPNNPKVATTTRITFIDFDQSYSSLYPNEKRILDLYFETNKEVVDFLKNDYGAKENYKDEVSLKVYNDTYAIIFIPAGKGGSYPIKFNIKDKTTQEVDGVFLFGNVTQSKDYEVYIYDTGLKSLKFGEFDFKDISNSKLNKNETYTQEIGFADSYETRIENNILLISIYKKDSGGMSPKNTKLREVEYVLP